jgi:ligand-binding SRPBCC domain-containing protein
MKHSLRTVQWVPYPASKVFAFFADPRNLPPLMPAWQKARIEEMTLIPARDQWGNTMKTPVAAAGSRITITFRAVPKLPIRMTWDAVIVDFEWNYTFADEQQPRGPFRYWHHRHTVTEEALGTIDGSQVEDEVEYELPLGLLGETANRLVVARQLRKMFAYRQRRLLELLRAHSSALNGLAH